MEPADVAQRSEHLLGAPGVGDRFHRHPPALGLVRERERRGCRRAPPDHRQAEPDQRREQKLPVGGRALRDHDRGRAEGAQRARCVERAAADPGRAAVERVEREGADDGERHGVRQGEADEEQRGDRRRHPGGVQREPAADGERRDRQHRGPEHHRGERQPGEDERTPQGELDPTAGAPLQGREGELGDDQESGCRRAAPAGRSPRRGSGRSLRTPRRARRARP